MNDRELDLALAEMGTRHTRVTVPPVLRERVNAVPLQVPARRSWLTPSPTRRFGSAVSAVTFVVAGVIVALFGGFLLAGLLTSGPHAEQPPPVGASASSQATPSDAATPAPERPTPTELDRRPVQATRSDLVPGVDLTVEVVDPGVFRVLDDGVRDLTQNIWDVAASASGDVFTMSYRPTELRASGAPSSLEDFGVIHLGEPGRHTPDRPKDSHLYRVADGSVVLALSKGRAEAFRDGRWNEVPYEQRLPIDNPAKTPEGGSWTSLWTGERAAWYNVRFASDLDRWYTRDEIGLAPDEALLGDGVPTDDGGAWYVLVRLSEEQRQELEEGQSNSAAELSHGGTTPFAGLVRFDGDSWSRVQPGGAGTIAAMPTGYDFAPLVVGPSGNVWFTGLDASGTLVLAQWDGSSWSIHRDEEQHAWTALDALWPVRDGAIWIGDSTVFNGSDFRYIPVPSSPSNREPHLLAIDHAPNGSTWMVVTDGKQGGPSGCNEKDPCEPEADGLFVITPEAWTAAE